MTWRTILVEDSEKLRLKLDNILIEKESKEYIIPLSDISIIVLDGQTTSITTRLLTAISKHNIGLVTCNHEHHPIGMYHGFYTHSRASKMLQKQINLSERFKEQLWTQIIKFKIENQKQVLELCYKNEVTIDKLEDYIESVQHYDKTNREGHAAKVYFNEMFGMTFTRDDKNNVFNAGLNYGYAILRAHLARLIVGYGLTPALGVFHRSEYNAFNLADDLIEVFRPFVDYLVYEMMYKEEYFTRYHRLQLVDMINHRCVYQNGTYTLQDTMKKFVIDILSAYEDEEISYIKRPRVETYEVLK